MGDLADVDNEKGKKKRIQRRIGRRRWKDARNSMRKQHEKGKVHKGEERRQGTSELTGEKVKEDRKRNDSRKRADTSWVAILFATCLLAQAHSIATHERVAHTDHSNPEHAQRR